MAASDPGDIAAEFLVEPFVEGSPGAHVTAAVDAFAAHEIEVELGPFASSAEGDVDAMADAIAEMIRAAMTNGATSIQLRVAATAEEIPVPTLRDALDDILRMAEREIGTMAPDWDRDQKQRVVRMLEERGAFQLRGAVDDIARIMGVSRITIYNYLNAIEAETDG
ncbi:MAG: DNA-binding protein [Acidimicrobiales bacterium]|nr:MAG: DNA-binding protein [Acidimicrobiales bacterium]